MNEVALNIRIRVFAWTHFFNLLGRSLEIASQGPTISVCLTLHVSKRFPKRVRGFSPLPATESPWCPDSISTTPSGIVSLLILFFNFGPWSGCGL